MTPQDRHLAREALLRRRLNIDQVSEIQRECQASRLPFGDVAIRRGLLLPDEVDAILDAEPTPVPPVFPWLLVGTIAILAVLVSVGLLHVRRQHERDRELADASMRDEATAEREARAVLLARQREQLLLQQAQAEESLAKARELMKKSDDLLRRDPANPDLHLLLVDATVGFNRWLEVHVDDAPVYIERSRAYELRRDFERALADLDRAIELRKDLAPSLDARIQGLRLQVATPRK